MDHILANADKTIPEPNEDDEDESAIDIPAGAEARVRTCLASCNATRSVKKLKDSR